MSNRTYKLKCVSCKKSFDAKRSDAKYCSVSCQTYEYRHKREFSKMDVHFSSADVEWYTPEHVVDLARIVLGEINLDPASCAEANLVVKAERFYSQVDDGLKHIWSGTVWLNPPYGRGINKWLDKLRVSYEAGDTKAALTLLPNRPGSKWFQNIAIYPRCDLHGRLKFGNTPAAAPFPSVLFYLGTNLQKFSETFSAIGLISYPAIGSPGNEEV